MMFVPNSKILAPFTFAKVMFNQFGASVVWPLVNTFPTDPGNPTVAGTVPAYDAPDLNGSYFNLTPQAVAGPVPGSLAPTFNGSTSYMNIFRPLLTSILVSGVAISTFSYTKFPSGAWTDGAVHYVYDFYSNNGNRTYLRKSSTNNQLQAQYSAGAVNKVTGNTVLGGTTTWMGLGVTIDKAADELKMFGNGAQVGTTTTGLGVWAGSITAATIGSFAVSPPVGSFSGQQAYVAVRVGLPVWTAANYAAMQAFAATVLPDT